MTNACLSIERRIESQLSAYTDELYKLMGNNERIVVLTADLVGSCKLSGIEAKYPGRFINTGVAEQNMVSIAAGLAREGFIPFVHSFSAFTSMRSCEQVRTDAFYNELNVKVVGTHSGVSTGPAGSTHYSLEDIGIIRSMPKSRIISPADAVSARKLVCAIVEDEGPIYLRLDRNPLTVLYNDDANLSIGKGSVLLDGSDAALVATGVMVSTAMDAAREIERKYGKKLSVIDIHTIKPVDEELIRTVAEKHSYVFTMEEHNIYGGLGSAVAEIIAESGMACRLKRIGIQDIYPMGGPLTAVRNRLGLTVDRVVEAIERHAKLQSA